MKAFSKRVLSLTMATAMVLSVAAVPTTDANAASSYSLTKRAAAYAGKTYNYSLNGVTKSQYAKVSVSGTAKDLVTVKKGSKTIKSSTKIAGTGKKITLKVTANKASGKKYALTAKIYNNKTNKLVKTLKGSTTTVYNHSIKSISGTTTVEAGQTTKLTAVKKYSQSNGTVTWKSSNTAVATVAADGTVTGVTAGPAVITATCGAYSQSVEVTVTAEGEKKPEAFTLTAEATKADTITATLSREVAADATVTVMKEGRTTAVDGKATITGTTLEFKGTANFTNGTYTITVKEGELSADATVTVQDEYVKDIVITSKQALTNAVADPGNAKIVPGSEAYIYYDVLNQYGESLRQSTNIEWSFSANKKSPSFVDKNTGRLTVTNGEPTGADAKNLTPFTYGSTIYVTGVYTKTGASVQQAVTVGLAQALDSVEVAGFINVKEPTKIVETIPTDFGKDTWVLAYKALDQDGNNITDSYPSTKNPVGTAAVVGDDITLISDNPLLIKSDFKDDNTFTVNGEIYNSVLIQPGQYVDKGGEVSITAISNKTGNKTTKVLTVGAGALLESLTLKQPTKIVASNDQGVVIPFTAKDTNGNDVTAYETIVRSSNELNLTASEGVITIKENNDGTAAITWSDTKYEKYGDKVINVAGSGESLEDCDGYDRTVSLTTVVVGGTSENMMLSVADTRVPNAIKSVKVLGSEEDLVSAVSGYSIDFMTNDVTYLDQYGDVMKTVDSNLNQVLAKNFFDYTKAGNKTYGKGANAANYGVRVDAKASGTYLVPTSIPGTATVQDITDANDTFVFRTVSGNAVNTGSLKYSIISAAPGKAFSNASKVKVATYNIIPVAKLSGLGFNTLDKQQLSTVHSQEANGAAAGLKDDTIKKELDAGTYTVKAGSNVSVAGTYTGKTVKLPLSKWSQNPAVTHVADSGFNLAPVNAFEAKITGFTNNATVSSNTLYWNELYNANTAKFERRDASKKLHTWVDDAENGTRIDVKANVALSDAPSIITSVQIDNKGILNPDDTVVDFEDMVVNKKTLKVVVKDQYGHTLKKDVDYVLSYKVDKYAENTGDLAHVVNSYGITGNNSSAAKVRMAEIKDAFNLTVIADAIGTTWGSGSDAKDITLGADTKATINSVSNATDKNFRKGKLNYDR